MSQRETGIKEVLSHWSSQPFGVLEPMVLPQRTSVSNERPIFEKGSLTGKATFLTYQSRGHYHKEWLGPTRVRDWRSALSLATPDLQHSKADDITTSNGSAQRETEIREQLSHRLSHLLDVPKPMVSQYRVAHPEETLTSRKRSLTGRVTFPIYQS
jgi:hypothetical protein